MFSSSFTCPRSKILYVIDMHGAVFLSNSATDTQGFCMHDDRICVVCFRGTESLRDWMTNLNFVLVHEPLQKSGKSFLTLSFRFQAIILKDIFKKE